MLEDLISKPLEKLTENPLGSAVDLLMCASPEAKLASMLLPGASKLVDNLFGAANISLDKDGNGVIEIADILNSTKLIDSLL